MADLAGIKELVVTVCDAFGITRDEFLKIVKEEAEDMGLTILEEVLAQC
jgi:hypothetical protein